jgi:osmotically-inducible protein OsmY
MNRESWTFLCGADCGATLMYMFDPERGNRRRALVRDKVVSAGNKTGMYAGKMSRDLSNRAQGLVAETRTLFRREEVSDDVLVQRVKAELGRHSVHQRALEVTAEGGRVTLRGPALADEVDALVKAASSVRGVNEVDARLEVHEEAGSISSLQGDVRTRAAAG